MAVVRMSKVGIVGCRDEAEKIISLLQREGAVQIIEQSEQKDSASEFEGKLRQIDFCTVFLSKFAAKQSSKPVFTTSELALALENFDLDDTLSKISELAAKQEELTASLSRSQAYHSMLAPWLDLKYDLSSLEDTPNTKIRLGVVPAHTLQIFQNEVIEQPLLSWQEVKAAREGTYIIIAYHKKISDWADALLAKVEFTHWDPKFFKKSPTVETVALETEIMRLEKQLATIAEKARAMANKIPSLLASADSYEQMLAAQKVITNANKTAQTFFLQGWIPQEKIPRLKKRMEASFEALELIELPILPEEVPPVQIKNGFFVEAFEIITDLYGRPAAGMIDPTPVLAPFFAIYFALCLTDAGYGLLVTAISIIGLYLMRKKSFESRKFFRLGIYVGVPTIIAGILTGGYFGLPLPNATEATGLAALALKLKLFDPVRDMNTFFIISIAFGAVQLSVGYILSGYLSIVNSQKFASKLHGVFTGLAWAVTAFGLGFFLMGYLMPNELGHLGKIGVMLLKYGVYGMLFGHLVLGTIAGMGVGMSLANALGFSGLYGIIGVFADLLSFLRLAALGLCTGIVAGVINQLAFQMKGWLFIFGILLMIGGHLFYCAFSALGAFVHPTRLQFVEFFSKFYESGGKNFEPFRRKFRRIEVL